MKFQLPQFIQTETKLVGPFTLKQFMWIAAGAALLIMVYIFASGIWFIMLAIPVVAASLGLAFVKIDNVPLMNYVVYILSYTLNPKKYTYQKEGQPVYQNVPPSQEPPAQQ